MKEVPLRALVSQVIVNVHMDDELRLVITAVVM